MLCLAATLGVLSPPTARSVPPSSAGALAGWRGYWEDAG